MALGAGLTYWSLGLYINPLEEEFGWSRAEVSLGISIAFVTSGISGPLVGRWIDSKGPRSAILIATVMVCISWVLLSTTNYLWQWYLFLSMNSAFWLMLFVIPFQTMASRWFTRRRGVALSALAAGFSLGGFVVVPLQRLIIDDIGWREAFLASAGLVACLFLPLAIFVFRDRPQDLGLNPDGYVDETPEARPRVATGVSLGQAIRTPLFWVLTLSVMLFIFSVFGWLVHQVPFFESVGVSRGTAALIVSVSAAFTIFTRLIAGTLADRVRKIERLAMTLILFLIGAFVTLLISSSTVGIVIFAVLWTIGSGASGGIWGMLISRSFGVAHFASILGVFMVVQTIGQVVSPSVAGAIFDATESYELVLVIFGGSLTGSWCLFYVASHLSRPGEMAETIVRQEPVAGLDVPAPGSSRR